MHGFSLGFERNEPSKTSISKWSLVGILLLMWLGSLACQETSAQESPSSSAVSVAAPAASLHPIDGFLQPLWNAAGTSQPVPCSDEVFIRRVTLDLVGRGPSWEETKDFLANPDRAQVIDRLLESREFSNHWSELWAGHLVGDDTTVEKQTLQQWLFESIEKREAYDAIATELIAAEGDSAFDGAVNFLVARAEEPAIPVSRIFLGIRLDCARCHDHPFDRWTEDDYREFTRFFNDLERTEVSSGNIRLSDPIRGESEEEAPKFLTGAQPRTGRWRSELAFFMTRSKPFARNFANRLWYHMFGVGIVDPVDDFNAQNPPISVELLEWLATEARQSNFDLRHMLRLICTSEAYQASAVSTSATTNSDAVRRFAVHSIKPLTAEQWYDSMQIAFGDRQELGERDDFARMFRGEMDSAQLGTTWAYRETLFGLLERLAADSTLPTNDIDELFLRVLSRRPSEQERELFANRPMSEIAFALLHSHEFAFVP